MQDTANIVIIGGGVIGVSCAFFLAKEGVKEVVLLEKNQLLGAESTGLCAGGIRQQFSTEINTRLCMASVEIFENFTSYTGETIDFCQAGYLFLAQTQKQWEIFQKNVKMHKFLGLDVELVTPQRIKEIAPFLKVDDLIGGTFCQKDGFADPNEVTQSFATAAKKSGVKIYTETKVTGIKLTNNKIESIITNKGEIKTNCVINAAGPWSAEIAKMININLPVVPYRRQLFITEPFPEIPDKIPMIIDFEAGLYFRKESGGIMMGMADPKEKPGFNLHVDWNFLSEIVEKALHRVPALEKANIMRGWAGLYEITPDHHAILGKIPEIEGFILANGFSGHGFMQAPIVGKIIAEIIAGKPTSMDISSLSYTRFKEGKLIEESRVF